MTYRKKRKNPLRIILPVIVLIAALAVGILWAKLSQKVSALQQGAAFTLRYEITPNSAQTPPLLHVLQQANATTGSISGQYAPGRLQLSLYGLNPDSTVQTSPFTRVYIDAEETLFDVAQIYSLLCQSVTAELPIAGAILPQWTLGDYISQTQAAAVLGVEARTVELQDLSGFSLSLKDLKKVSPSGARQGYRYYRLPAAADGATLTLGFESSSLFAGTTPVHIMLSIPGHGVRVQLSGTITAQKTVLTPPASRMQDEDINTLVQIRQSLESVWKMLRSATQSAG